MNVEINKSRLDYLLHLHGMRRSDLLARLSENRKNPVLETEIFGDEIAVSQLKKIDGIFEKGLHYYLNPTPPPTGKEASVFFRKEVFNSELNFRSHKVVNEYEGLANRLHGWAKLSEISFKRTLRKRKLSDDPQKVALELRPSIYPDYIANQRTFLQRFIAKLAEKNIFVFEFIENHNRNDKANIDGFFLKPNMIVLKRQKHLKREIFSLGHELGHYLLEEEEIEEIQPEHYLDQSDQNAVESWCHQFAFHLIAGEWAHGIDELSPATSENDYHDAYVRKIASKTHISTLAIYTRMLFQKQISSADYQRIRKFIKEAIEKQEERVQSLDDERSGFGVSKPINSPLTISTLQVAFHHGLVSEYDVSKALNMKGDKLAQYLE